MKEWLRFVWSFPPGRHTRRLVPYLFSNNVVILFIVVRAIVPCLPKVNRNHTNSCWQIRRHHFSVIMKSGSGSQDSRHERSTGNRTYRTVRECMIKRYPLLGQLTDRRGRTMRASVVLHIVNRIVLREQPDDIWPISGC